METQAHWNMPAAQVKSQFEGSLDYTTSLELAEVTYQDHISINNFLLFHRNSDVF